MVNIKLEKNEKGHWKASAYHDTPLEDIEEYAIRNTPQKAIEELIDYLKSTHKELQP